LKILWSRTNNLHCSRTKLCRRLHYYNRRKHFSPNRSFS